MCVPTNIFPNEFTEQLNFPKISQKISQEISQDFPTIMRIITSYSSRTLYLIFQVGKYLLLARAESINNKK